MKKLTYFVIVGKIELHLASQELKMLTPPVLSDSFLGRLEEVKRTLGWSCWTKTKGFFAKAKAKRFCLLLAYKTWTSSCFWQFLPPFLSFVLRTRHGGLLCPEVRQQSDQSSAGPDRCRRVQICLESSGIDLDPGRVDIETAWMLPCSDRWLWKKWCLDMTGCAYSRWHSHFLRYVAQASKNVCMIQIWLQALHV